jgi:prepilin-type N-terminal cleavage/methylation domain-containing protein
MKNSKKGFTLTEVLIVTAIIVILSGAAIAGIAVTVSNAKERGEKIQASQGVNWESEAVLKVKKTKIELGNEQFYEESADTPTPTGAATDKLESTPTSTPASTPKPTTTPASTPKPTTTPASTPKPTTTPASTPKPTNTPASTPKPTTTPASGTVGSKTGTTAVTGTSVSGDSINSMSVSLPTEVKEFTVYFPTGSVDGMSCYGGNCSVTVSGKYATVKIINGTTSGNGFGIWGDVNNINVSDIKVVSYVT